MLPLFLPCANTDVSARAEIDEGYVVDATNLGTHSLLTGANALVRVRSTTSGSFYSLDLSGLYARLSELTIGAPNPAATNTYGASLGARTLWSTSPSARVFFEGTGFIASRLGVRADNPLAARDPFALDRVEYAIDTQLGWSGLVAKGVMLRLSGGYLGAGGIASADPSAVGVDLHGGRAIVSTVHEVTTRDYVVPEIRFIQTHYYHAILDTFLDRGAADVSAATATLGVTHVVTRRLMASVGGGVTVATPPPILGSRAEVVEPEARAAMTYASKRSSATATYTYGYTSLGPRIGFGQAHSARVDLRLRPVSGALYRELELRGVAGFSYGSAPVAASLITLATAAEPPDETGVVTTLAATLGAHLDVPIVRGLFFTSGLDLQYLRATLSPIPPGGEPGPAFIQVITIGLAGTLSTDPHDLVRPGLGMAEGATAAGRPDPRVGEGDVDANMLGQGGKLTQSPPQAHSVAPPAPDPSAPSSAPLP